MRSKKKKRCGGGSKKKRKVPKTAVPRAGSSSSGSFFDHGENSPKKRARKRAPKKVLERFHVHSRLQDGFSSLWNDADPAHKYVPPHIDVEPSSVVHFAGFLSGDSEYEGAWVMGDLKGTFKYNVILGDESTTYEGGCTYGDETYQDTFEMTGEGLRGTKRSRRNAVLEARLLSRLRVT